MPVVTPLAYRMATALVSPLVPLWLAYRLTMGKEDPKRILERTGRATRKRPAGTLVWLHAASIGEANSVLLLIGMIRERFPALPILLTTGTVTSARLMQARLPPGVIHQYVPVDTPQAVGRFLRHWKPDIALWVESEFWPNLVLMSRARYCFMCVVNARMSQRSAARWRKQRALIGAMLPCFAIAFTQTEGDGKRLKQLGAKEVLCLGNLKYDALLLPCDESALIALRQLLGQRTLWLAASTHPGEEEQIVQAHAQLLRAHPKLLTVIVPRHPERGEAIAQRLRVQGAARRALAEPITAQTQFYVADTLGELGLFYRLCEISFIGGSLVVHGGQNPLEAARLACCVIAGPHTENFAEIYDEMEKIGVMTRVKNARELAQQVHRLLTDSTELDVMQQGAKKWVESKTGAAGRLLEVLAPVLAVQTS